MTKNNMYLIIGVVIGIIIVGAIVFMQRQSNGNSGTPNVSKESEQGASLAKKGPPSEIDARKAYSAVLRTDKGDITIELNAAETPITVNNFVVLARKQFYNGTPFHRVVKGFMIQGGDPKGDGTGGPGYEFDNEPFTGEYVRGTVAMANAGKNTNGSQFFIMHGDVPLPKEYVIFGKVTAGMEVVDAIATAEVEPNEFGENSKPLKPVTVTSVEIREK